MKNLHSIEKLDLNNNMISYLGPNDLTGMVACTYLSFNDNPLSAATTELIIPVNLLTLRIRAVDIETLTIRCVSSNTCSINTLYLESGFIQTPVVNDIKDTLSAYTINGIDGVDTPADDHGFTDDAFTNFPILKHLFLNRMHVNPFPAVSNILTLRLLNLRQIGLKDDDLMDSSGGLMSLVHLEEIALSNNNLAHFPSFGSYPVLFNLDISKNYISYLPVDTVSCMRRLERLILNANPIINVADLPYKALHSLQFLDIRYLLQFNVHIHDFPMYLIDVNHVDQYISYHNSSFPISLHCSNIEIPCDCSTRWLKKLDITVRIDPTPCSTSAEMSNSNWGTLRLTDFGNCPVDQGCNLIINTCHTHPLAIRIISMKL